MSSLRRSRFRRKFREVRMPDKADRIVRLRRSGIRHSDEILVLTDEFHNEVVAELGSDVWGALVSMVKEESAMIEVSDVEVLLAVGKDPELIDRAVDQIRYL